MAKTPKRKKKLILVNTLRVDAKMVNTVFIAKHINNLGHKRAHQQTQDSRVEMKAGRKYVLVQNS